MRGKSRLLFELSVIVILIVCASWFFASCHREPQLVPVGEIDIIGFTEDGNVIVTPALIADYYRLKKLEKKWREGGWIK